MGSSSGTARAQLLTDGSATLSIDGATEHLQAADVGAARALITDRLRHHARDRGEDLHAILIDPLGHWALTITPAGMITTGIGAEPADATAPPADTPRDPDLAVELFGDPPSPTAAAPTATTHPPPPAPAKPARRGPLWSPPTVSRAHAVAAAAVAATLVAGAGVAWVVNRDDGVTAQLQPVQGWTQTAAWVSDPVPADPPSPGGVLPVDGTIATTLDHDGTSAVAALDPTTGESLWTEPLTEPLTGPLQAVGDDRRSLAATTAHSLLLWDDPASLEPPQRWRFSEADVAPVAGSPVPLLANPDTATALTIHDGQLLRRTLPSGARAVAALPTGAVLAVSADGHWWSVADQLSEATFLQPPTYGARVKSIAGVAGTTLIVTWTHGAKGTSVAGYDLTDQMAATWHLDAVPGDAAQVTTSPDGSWMIVGAVAIDVATGAATYLPQDWRTLRLTNEAAWSRDYVAPKMAPATRLAAPVADAASIPVATAASGRGLVVQTDDDDATRLLALEPDGAHAYDDGPAATPAAPPRPTTSAPPRKTTTTTRPKPTKSTQQTKRSQQTKRPKATDRPTPTSTAKPSAAPKKN